MAKRDSTIIYRSFYEALKNLTKEDRADVWDAIMEYSLNFKQLKLSGVAQTVFTLVKPQLDANNRRFKNGAKPKRTGSDNEARMKREQSKPEANNNNNDNNNVNENENTKKGRVVFKKPSPQELLSYLTEIGIPQEARGFWNHYQSNGWKVGKNKMSDWQAACRTWKDRREERLKEKSAGKPSTFSQLQNLNTLANEHTGNS